MTLERIIAFERHVQRGCAERVVDLPFGWAVLCGDLPLVFDLNTVVLNTPDADPQVVLDTTEQILAEAGVTHRRLIVDPPADPAPVVAAATARGWRTDRIIAMALRRAPDREVDTAAAVEVELEEYLPIQRRFHGEEPWSSSAVLDQMDVANRRLAEFAALRAFAVQAEAGCLLIGVGDVAQIDSVHTLEEHRGRGLGRIVVQRAVEAAREAGYEVIHLFADTDDWPRELYAKLGFDAVGEVVTCHR